MRAALALVPLALLSCAHGPTHAARWQRLLREGPRELPALAATVEWVRPAAGPAEGGHLALLRAEPHARIEAVAASDGQPEPLSAEAWSARLEAPNAVWNAGFYGPGGQHVGLLKAGGRWRQRRQHADWRGLLFSSPSRPGLPAWQLVDLQASPRSRADLEELLAAYDTVVQGMVLFDVTGESRTRPSSQAAARTAMGIDTRGRLVVALTEGPWTLEELSKALRTLETPLVWAVNLDGGLESQLALRPAGTSGALALTSRHGTRGAIPEEWTARLPTRPLPAVLVLLPPS